MIQSLDFTTITLPETQSIPSQYYWSIGFKRIATLPRTFLYLKILRFDSQPDDFHKSATVLGY